ncbi:stress enhanced protein 1, chloroplastic [Dioscorea cayenensis subsp. rotundata]|uniref:Stress enhanced protein 1, chloroplastic n=1 Tax=Dioscorea cayennensis subsp. rotundata TaxID=55577 RepID=A0AB40BRP6_DIOCR|nr:stress enhanced protein 1, chloroplastic [Dioscorea cayenensis subsp. rotundata]
MAHAGIAASSLCVSLPNVAARKPQRTSALLRPLGEAHSKITASSFKRGTPLFLGSVLTRRKFVRQATQISIRCEQGTKEDGGLDVWLGRLAMVGFATAITVEITTGKGLLENFGFTSPLPTLALVVTALVGVLTAFFIFQSASQN